LEIAKALREVKLKLEKENKERKPTNAKRFVGSSFSLKEFSFSKLKKTFIFSNSLVRAVNRVCMRE
jgi:hypothetical protein